MNDDKQLSHADVLHLAAEAELDPRTVRRAWDEGLNALRSEVDRARLIRAAAKLRIEWP
jgi:hypothetical protein